MNDGFIRKKIYNTILDWTNSKKGKPIKMLLQTTYRCNLYCLFCENLQSRKEGNFDYSKELSLKEWYKIIKDSAELGVRSWWISGGGEPMCNKKITIGIIKKIKELPFKTETCITTNGTEFNVEDIKELIKNQLDLVVFSIDSPNERNHDLLRGKKGTFKNAIKALHQFAIIKKKLNSRNPYIKISAILNNYNILNLTKFVKLAKENGCFELSLCPLIIMKGTKNLIKKMNVQIKEINIDIIKEINAATILAKKISLKFNIRLGISYESKNHKIIPNKILNSYCYEPYYFMLITPFGNISPCCTYGHGYNNFNIKNKNLNDIWFSKEFESLRNDLCKGTMKYKCRNCELGFFSRDFIRKLLVDYKNG